LLFDEPLTVVGGHQHDNAHGKNLNHNRPPSPLTLPDKFRTGNPPHMPMTRSLPISLITDMRVAAMLVILTVPWLNPFTLGPTASVVPLLMSWICAALLLLTSSRHPASLPILRPLGGLALLLALVALWPSKALPNAEPLALAMSLLAILACAVRFAHATQADAVVLARAWVLAGLASALMGWVQYVGAADALAPWVSPANLGEAFGNLRQRNLYASLTSLALCALLWLARCDPWFSRPARVMGPAVLLAAGNALSHSRTGLFELLLILALAGIWGLYRERAVRWTLAPVLPAYLVAALGLPALFTSGSHAGIFTRLAEGAPSCSSRMTLWSNVVELIGQRPWFGWGWGRLDYAHYMHLYEGARFCDILDNAHNLPLHLAVELGVPMALILCGAALWATWRSRPWRESDPLRQLAWTVLAVLALHSLLEYPLWYGPFQMALGISLGLLWPARRANASRPFVAVALAVPLMAGVALGALDYHRAQQIYLAPEERAAAYRDHTLEKVRAVWIFRDQVRFAELTTTPLERGNAKWTHAMATSLLTFSPEPRVIEKAIESAVMLGRDDEALQQLVRFRAAFPKDHAEWAAPLHGRPSRSEPEN
jgi:O-antigen ligase